MMRARIP
jgi:hypothetical protein